MRVIPPLTITPAMITSSTASEPLLPSAYAGGTTYALAAFVSVATDYTIYQSLAAGNVGNTPNISPTFWKIVGLIETAWLIGTTYALNDVVSYNHVIYQSLQAANIGNNPFNSPLFWSNSGATNKYRCFDTLRNTTTVQASPITVVLTPGVRVNSLATLGLIADSVRIRMVSSAVTVYDQTINLIQRQVVDWFDYFFEPFYNRTSVVVFNLPPFTNGVITIDITRISGNVECGTIVLGTCVDLGKTQYSAVSDAINFSTITRDTFGNSILIARRNVPKTTQQVWAPAAVVNKINNVRDLLNAVPAVWSGLDDNTQPYFESLLILGIYKGFSIALNMPDFVISTIELEEV